MHSFIWYLRVLTKMMKTLFFWHISCSPETTKMSLFFYFFNSCCCIPDIDFLDNLLIYICSLGYDRLIVCIQIKRVLKLAKREKQERTVIHNCRITLTLSLQYFPACTMLRFPLQSFYDYWNIWWTFLIKRGTRADEHYQEIQCGQSMTSWVVPYL